MPYQVAAQAALARWRAAQAILARSDPESPAWLTATAEVRRARFDYQAAVDAARAAHLPEPPPFDEAAAEALALRPIRTPEADLDAIGDLPELIERYKAAVRHRLTLTIGSPEQDAQLALEGDLSRRITYWRDPPKPDV